MTTITLVAKLTLFSICFIFNAYQFKTNTKNTHLSNEKEHKRIIFECNPLEYVLV